MNWAYHFKRYGHGAKGDFFLMNRPISDISARAAGRRLCSGRARVLLFSGLAGNFGLFFAQAKKKRALAPAPQGQRTARSGGRFACEWTDATATKGAQATAECGLRSAVPGMDTRATVPASGAPRSAARPCASVPRHAPSLVRFWSPMGAGLQVRGWRHR